MNKLKRITNYLSSDYYMRAGNQELEDSIALKLNKLCKKYGELKYEIVKHTVTNSYKDLSILEKKLLIDKLYGTVIMNKLIKDMVNLPITSKETINSLLTKYDNSLVSSRTNILLSESAIYLKFKVNNKYLSIDKIVKPLFLEFLDTKVIRHAIINGYKVPMVNVESQEEYEKDITKVYKAFTKEEINYM